jgi:ribosomal protein L37AE/L43A
MGSSNKHKKAMALSGKMISLKFRNEYDISPKLCKFCSAPIPYEKRNSNKFCNQSCSASYNNIRKDKKYPPKKCKSCSKEFTPKRINDGVYCSPNCQHEFQGATRLNEWINYGKFPGKITLKKYLTETQGYKCSCCGINEWNFKPIILEIDHIDGNSENNAPENLRFICPNCHSQTDTYKGKNKGNGRHYRRERYASGQSY